MARNVVKAPGRSSFSPEKLNGKIPAAEFARLSGTTAARVLRYLKAWDAAAGKGEVPSAADRSNGSAKDSRDPLPSCAGLTEE